MANLYNELQSRFDRFNLRMNAIKHSSPAVFDSKEFEVLWKKFVSVSNEYKPEYSDEEIQAAIDAIDAILEFLSDK